MAEHREWHGVPDYQEFTMRDDGAPLLLRRSDVSVVHPRLLDGGTAVYMRGGKSFLIEEPYEAVCEWLSSGYLGAVGRKQEPDGR